MAGRRDENSGSLLTIVLIALFITTLVVAIAAMVI